MLLFSGKLILPSGALYEVRTIFQYFGYIIFTLHRQKPTSLGGQYKTWTAECGPRTADWVQNTDSGLSIKHGLGMKSGLRTTYTKTALQR